MPWQHSISARCEHKNDEYSRIALYGNTTCTQVPPPPPDLAFIYHAIYSRIWNHGNKRMKLMHQNTNIFSGNSFRNIPCTMVTIFQVSVCWCINEICVRMNKHTSLHWCHNDHDGVSNHQPHGCILNRLFRRRSKKTSKLRVTGLCEGNSPGPVNSPHKGPVTWKLFPFDDVIMCNCRHQGYGRRVNFGVEGSQKDIDGLVQGHSNTSAWAMDLLQSCTKPWMWAF